jgi:oligopeptide/dipeptide ABC transporter ATP-binding protein
MLLEVSDLRVSYPGLSGNLIPVLRGVSFSCAPGEVVGLLGESGCGKSTIALAMLAALPAGSAVSGSIRFLGRELLSAVNAALRALRGADLSIVFQEPRLALHPTMRVGEQIAEIIRAHKKYRKALCRSEAMELMRKIGLAESMYDAYPHQISGGELQRVCIAQAIACEPSLIVADEPTASLDTVTQADILRLFADLKTESKAGMLFISHHPATLKGLADRICVMYSGEMIETGNLDEVFSEPLHPYTQALLKAVPPAPGAATTKRLAAIPGDPPLFADSRPGCAFAPRCTVMRTDCRERAPVFSALSPSRTVKCLLYEH